MYTAKIIDSYSSFIADSKSKGHNIILVTSGAVGIGCQKLGIKERPEELTNLQAVAAVGQVHLMGLYEKAMNSHGFKVAQILLTQTDLSTRVSYRNASITFKKLLEWKKKTQILRATKSITIHDRYHYMNKCI